MKPLLPIFVSVFIAELGDKTQLATLLFATDQNLSRMGVFVAASAALVLSTLFAVVLGEVIGRLREIDCWEIARVAKRAGAPVNMSAGVRLCKSVGDVVRRGEPIFEIHAQSETQLEFGRAYAESHPERVRFGF